MLKRSLGATAVALAAFALPAAAQQKTAPPPPPAARQQLQQGPQPTAEQQAWINELRQIGQRLQTAQIKALQDSTLQAQQQALGAEFKTAMEKQDPGLAGVAQRVETMETEARKAEQAGDEAKLKQLTQEAQGIQMRFAKAQAEALKNPALAAKAKAFEQRVEQRVRQIEPETPKLLARGQELQSKLTASVQQKPTAANPRPGGQR